jgi:hypothetical protein
MNEAQNGQPDDAGLSPAEALLPWYATGRLSEADRTQVENALAGDEKLRRYLALVREETADTISVNENIRTPSAAAMDKLMAKIDLYEARHPRGAFSIDRVLSWISNALSGLSPRTLAWSATAAAVVICLEGGLLTGLLAGRQSPELFKTASLDTKAESEGTYALISFVGSVSMQDATAFLQNHHASLLDGPKPGGFYRIKVADQKLTGEALNAKLTELRGQINIVSFLLPETPKP